MERSGKKNSEWDEGIKNLQIRYEYNEEDKYRDEYKHLNIRVWEIGKL